MMRLAMASQDADVFCVEISGAVTQSAFGVQDEPLEKQFGADVYRRAVLLNFSQVEFLDSRGVGWLLKCHKRFRMAGGILVLHSIPVVIQQVLKVLRMDMVLDSAVDEQTARAKATANSSP